MNALAEISTLPLSKSEQQNYADQAISEILSGNTDPVIIDMKLKAMEEVIKKIRKDARVQSYTIEEAEKWGKSFEKAGVKIGISQRTDRDFTGCGDPIYNQLLADLESLKAQIKARELMISTGVNPDTGETYSPPKTSTSTFLTYKF